MARNGWIRTSATLKLYGYDAIAWLEGGRWHWRAAGSGRRGSGEAMREAGARAAAHRWIVKQPDAKALHWQDRSRHWNGRSFDGTDRTAPGGRAFSSWRNTQGAFVGACGATFGESTNYPGERAKINCGKCLELLAESEQKAVAP